MENSEMDYESSDSMKRNFKNPNKVGRKCVICGAKPIDCPERKFHSFPKNPSLSEKWAEIVGRTDIINASSNQRNVRYRICSNHFADSDYASKSKLRFIGNAVPKLNISTSMIKVDVRKMKSKINNLMSPENVDTTVFPVAMDLDIPQLHENETVDTTVLPVAMDIYHLHENETVDTTVLPVVMDISQSHEKETVDTSVLNEVILTSTPIKSVINSSVADSSAGNLSKPVTPSTDSRNMKQKRVITPKTKRYRALSSKFHNLQRKYLKLNGKVSKEAVLKTIKCMVTPVLYNFIASQLKFSGISKYGRRWCVKDKNLALQIYLASPKAYYSLSKWFHLPSVTTLRKCVSGIQTNPGFNESILQSIKFLASKLKSYDKKCIVSFDAMKLKKGLSFDIKHDTVIGFEDYGSFTVSKPEIATHALVFMVRGLCKKWKQTFGFFFSRESASSVALKHLLDEAIVKLVQCGLDPIAVVCDQASNNRQLYAKKLGVTVETPYFFVKRDNFDHKVYALFDPPHLLKSMRNNFKKYGLKFMHKGLLQTALWDHIVAAWKLDSDMTHRFAPHLSRKHVTAKKFDLMNVRLATQVLSHSVASILCYMTAHGDIAGSGTADFCALMNDLFDSVNGRMIYHNERPLLSAVTRTSPHLESWETFTDFIKSVEFLIQKENVTIHCLHGWLVTLSAFRKMIPELLTDIPYILMSRFNQDCIENFFSVARRKGGNNDHPTPVDFRSRIRMLMAGQVITTCNTTNCEPDEDIVLVPLQILMHSEVSDSGSLDDSVTVSNVTVSDANVSDANVSDANNRDANNSILNQSADPDLIIDDVLTDDTDFFSDNIHETNSAAYVGGYIAHAILKKNQCNDCQKNLTKEKELSRELLFIYFKEYDNVKNGLKAPSDSWLKTICEFGRRFNDLFYKYCYKQGLLRNIMWNFRNIDHDWLNCTIHGNKIWELIQKKYITLMIYHKLKRISKDLNDSKKDAKKLKKVS